MLSDKRVLLISQFGVEGYSFLAKLACKYPKILWVSSNPYIPWNMLKIYSYSGHAKVLGFSKQSKERINPMNLNDLGIAVSSSIEKGRAIAFSCISELLMFHKVERVYYFLSNIMDDVEEGQFIGMMIEGAQSKKDELLIATLFDAVFRLRKMDDELVLLPELCLPRKTYSLKYKRGIVEIRVEEVEGEEVVTNV